MKRMLSIMALFLLFNFIIILDASSVTFIDHTGYQPTWATLIGQNQALGVCNTSIDYNTKDFSWCMEFAGYVLDSMSGEQNISFKDHGGYIPDWAKSMKKNQALGVCNTSIEYNSKDFGWCMEFAGKTLDELTGDVMIEEAVSESSNETLTISSIPSWIKNTARWWANDQIAELDFLNAIKFLIENEIIVIPESVGIKQLPSSQTSVPIWVKNNARWWSQGQIDDNDFVKGIEFLVNNGMIVIVSKNASEQQFSIGNLLPSKSSLEEIIPEDFSYIQIPKSSDERCLESIGLAFSYETIGDQEVRYSNGICKLQDPKGEKLEFDSRDFIIRGESQQTGRCYATPLVGSDHKTANVFCINDEFLFGTVVFLGNDWIDFETLLSIEEIIIENYHKQKYQKIVEISLEDIFNLEQYDLPTHGGTKASDGFSSLSCRQDDYGFVKMTGRFTNGPNDYSSIYFTLGIEDQNGNIVATGIGTISNVGAYQTRIFEAVAEWDGPFTNCVIEVSNAFP